MRMAGHFPSMLMLTVFSILLVYSTAASITCPTVPADLCSCTIDNNARKTINCRFKGLTEVPTFNSDGFLYDELLLGTLEDATCTGCNRITTIPANAFENLTVKSIDLLNNPISSVNLYAFDGANNVNIVELKITGDGNVIPPYDALELLNSLTTLQLKNYKQTVMNATNTRFLSPNLTSLTLDTFNGLSSIGANVFTPLKKLKSFHLKNMYSMTEVPVPGLIQLGSIDTLEISNTRITQVYTQTFAALTNLQDLQIQQNAVLQKIDNGAFQEISNSLIYLHLKGNDLGGGSNSGNSLDFLSENWSQLSQLDLGYNANLGNIQPSTFSTMAQLDYLNLQDIGLTEADSSMFTGLTNLHTLDIGYNYITLIKSRAFQNMPTLTELRINEQIDSRSGQPIVFESDAFGGIEASLQHLLIEYNRFDIPTFWTHLSTLTNLVELNVDDTGLIALPEYVFRHNEKLSVLHASFNNITDVNQTSFYGPKTSLTEIHLSDNQITKVDICTLSDFPTKPQLTVTGNPLVCDCDLAWLYDWVFTQPSPSDAVLLYVGECNTPANLAQRTFTDFAKTDMCPAGQDPIPDCPDLYATTTSTTSTTTSTTTTTTQTPEPQLPDFQLLELHKGEDFVQLTWTISSKTDLTDYKLEMVSNDEPKRTELVARDVESFTFSGLQPEKFYTFCLILRINNVYREDMPSCVSVNTIAKLTTTTLEPTTAAPEANIGLIVGTTVGGVVFVILVIIIIFVLLKANKPKKPPATMPVSFTMHPHATLPQAGGTAKRFAKSAGKDGKDGASPDDIQVTVISNGDMANRDRVSAGSYQFLNEKGVDNRPMPSTSNGGGQYANHKNPNGGYHNVKNPSYGHYTNAVEDRPLPKAPKGADWAGGATGHSYVNDRFAPPAKETSTNEYSEVRPDGRF